MDKTQEEKFEKWFSRHIHGLDIHGESMVAWSACLKVNGVGEEPRIPEGYFKIGEKVELKDRHGKYVKATVCTIITNADVDDSYLFIRRIPAWKPKDGEAVFVNLIEGTQVAKVLSADDGNVIQVLFPQGEKRAVELSRLKPFDSYKIGKPWSEIS